MRGLKWAAACRLMTTRGMELALLEPCCISWAHSLRTELDTVWME